MPPKPDLASHTLSHFLDKFVYRNAKASSTAPRGSSIMQPLAGGDSHGQLLSNRSSMGAKESLNSESFWRRKAEDVAVEDAFFHKYFTQIGKVKQTPSSKKSHNINELEQDGEDEDEIWQALVDSRPEIEGDSEDGSDMDMADLDSDLDGSIDNMVTDSEVELEPEDEEGSVNEDELFAEELEVGKTEDREIKESGSKQRRKMLKSLPTFASIEDYEGMLADDADEDF